jgi:hypothetical protein
MALNHDVEFNNTVKDYFNIGDYARASWHDLHSKFRLYLGDARPLSGTLPGMKLFKDYPLYPWNSPIVHP